MAIASVYSCHQCVCHTLVASVNSVNYCKIICVYLRSPYFLCFSQDYSNSCGLVGEFFQAKFNTDKPCDIKQSIKQLADRILIDKVIYLFVIHEITQPYYYSPGVSTQHYSATAASVLGR